MGKKGEKITKTSAKGKARGAFVFFIGDEGAILSYIEKGEVQRRLFSPSATATKPTETLKALLAEYPRSPIYLLIDMVEQSYVRHTLPPVSALGVNKIIQRRLARDFAPDDLKGALSLGREKSGRKDWTFLLIALAYKDSLRDWCDVVYDLPNRLMGIYLSPVESEQTLRSLKHALSTSSSPASRPKYSLPLPKSRAKNTSLSHSQTEWNILVVHNKTGGFRQVVLKNGMLVFTRMAVAGAEEKPSVLAGNIEQEMRNTIEYLKRLSFTDDAHLTIMIIVGQDIKDHLNAQSFGSGITHLLTPHEASELLGMKNSVLSGDRYSDVLLSCVFLFNKKKRLRLLPTYTKKTEACYQALQWTKILASLLLCGLLGGAAFSLFSAFQFQSQLSDVSHKQKPLEAKAQEFEDQAKTFKVDPFVVDSLIKTAEKIAEPSAYYRTVAEKLVPLIGQNSVLQSFDWSVGGLNTADPNAAPVAPPVQPSAEGDSAEQTQTEIVFEMIASSPDESSFARTWKKKLKRMQKAFEGYRVVAESPSGGGGSQDDLTLNFEEANTRAENAESQKMLINVKISGAEPQRAEESVTEVAP
jgi:hypothetical protein